MRGFCRSWRGALLVAGCLALAGIQPGLAQKALDGKVPERNSEPAGMSYGTFDNPEKLKIRYGHIAPDGAEPRATIILVHGMNEMIEKYFETFRDLTARGYEIWSMDWPGQGASGRYLTDPMKTHAVTFEMRTRDLHQFVTEIVPKSERPRWLFAHSMGGNLSLRYLHDHPETFSALVVTAPLIDINSGGLPKWVVRVIARGGNLLGLNESYLPGTSGPWVMDPNYSVTDSATSSDPERYAVHSDWYVIKPETAMGSPTIGWLNAALDSIDVLSSEGYLESINVPVLMASPQIDAYVDATAQAPACKRMPKCQLVRFDQSKHEPWMERDEIRNAWLADVDKFLTAQLAGGQ